jgi:aspartate carbamoyltransferase catalytic subunit
MKQAVSGPQQSDTRGAGTSGAPIQGDFTGRDVLSLDQFTPADLRMLFQLADKMKQLVQGHHPSSWLSGYVISLLFFEPSSRTFASFASAVKRLGGETIEIQNPETSSSVKKGESFEDTIRTFEAYSDALVLRHYRAGSAKKAADVVGGSVTKSSPRLLPWTTPAVPARTMGLSSR